MGRPAQTDLIELLAFLVDTKNTNVADVVVTAGIHAAGYINVQITQVMQIIEIIKPALEEGKELYDAAA